MADLRSRLVPSRRYPDPATSSDPVISALVNRLAALPPPKPDPQFRAELRAQLVAVTPRLVAEGVTAEDSAAPRRGRERALDGVRAAWRRIPLRRPLVAVGILLAVFALLLTGAVWLSRTTLPGDSLYGLKRASENVQLSLTSGDGARGREYLTLAKRRVDEAARLLSRSGASGPAAPGSINAHTAGLITGTLTDADSDLRNASRLLSGQAARTGSADPLPTLLKWTPGQVSRLTAIADRIPAGPLHDRAVSSKLLADRVLERANRLRADLGCSCLVQTSSDDLGPLPCTSPCGPAPPGTIAPTPGGPNAPTGGSRGPSSPPASGPLHSQTPSR
jgi:hypothetical protein